MNDYLHVLQLRAREGINMAAGVSQSPDHAVELFMKKNECKAGEAGVDFLALIVALTFGLSGSAWAQALSGEEIIKRELNAFYYAGKDLKARVSMRLMNAQGAVREREMTMLRTNVGSTGDQRYLIVFDAPADVRGMGFLVWKYAKSEDDRWLYFPALKSVKRIAADDKRSSFVGSDFTYEDISGRDLVEEQHKLVKSDEIDERKVYVVESVPKDIGDYSKRVSWIDQERWLPLKEEYFDRQGKLLRTFKAEKVENIGGNWTVTVRSMQNAQTRHKTEVALKSTQYDSGLNEQTFSERQLRNLGSLGRP